jgi:hypothetical protein
MRFLKPALVLGSATVMVVGLAGPANADRDTAFDLRGDARASLDLTKTHFRHTADGAWAKSHVRDLRKKGQFVFAVANRSNSFRFGVVATGHRDGSVTKKFYKFRNGNLTRIRCRAARVAWKPRRDTVTMSFPGRCFRPLPNRIVMAVGSTRNFPSGPTVDEGPSVVLGR